MWYRASNNVRFLLSALGLIGAITLPPWVPLLAMAILAFHAAPWEVIVIGFLVDLVWLPIESGTITSLPLFTLAGLVLAWGLEPLRSEFLTR